MSGRPEASPLVLIALNFEGGVDGALSRGAAEDLPRVVAWLNGDELRRRIVLDAAELQRRAGEPATDAQLAALGDAGRAWVRWAAARPWPLDPKFREAVLEVARREGLMPDGSDEDGHGG